LCYITEKLLLYYKVIWGNITILAYLLLRQAEERDPIKTAGLGVHDLQIRSRNFTPDHNVW
jgi:hypothetical protein